MSLLPQIPFDEDDFFLNGERRLPCVIVADRSYSMSGSKLDALNDGLQIFAKAISSDEMALKRVEAAIVSFGPVRVDQDFATLDRFTMPRLTCDGGTPMGEAVNKALDLIEARQAKYKANGVPSYTPWVWLITDGEPTDSWKSAAKRLQGLDKKGKVMGFGVGVDGADLSCLGQFTARPPVKLKETRFEEMFEFVSKVMSTVTHSRPGEKIGIAKSDVEEFAEFTA